MTDTPGEVEVKMALDQIRANCHEATMALQAAKDVAREYGFTTWTRTLYNAQRDIYAVTSLAGRYAEDHLSPSVRR